MAKAMTPGMPKRLRLHLADDLLRALGAVAPVLQLTKTNPRLTSPPMPTTLK